MDIAAFIFAPLLMALLYSRTWMGKLPRWVLVGLPVAVMAILFIAFLGYLPAVQEAITTKTPLIRTIEGVPFLTFHVDGLALLFALLVTSVGLGIAVVTSLSLEDGIVPKAFVVSHLALTSGLLFHILADKVDIVLGVLVLVVLPIAFLLQLPAPGEIEPPPPSLWQKAQVVLRVGGFACILILQNLLQQMGRKARQLTDSLNDVSQLSTANLSVTIAEHNTLVPQTIVTYEGLFAVLLTLLLVYILNTFFFWQRRAIIPAPRHALVALGLISSLYFMIRFYPAIHDNPLWWTVVTAVGLVMLLTGSVWALRQREAASILVCMVLSILGACIALLGLPGYLGVKAAVMTMVVYALVFPLLFLLPERLRPLKSGFTAALVLVGLALGLVDLWTIQAFYASTLKGAGIALAIVVLSTALITMHLLRVLQDVIFVGIWPAVSEFQQERTRHAAPLQVILGVLGLIALLCALLFDGLIAPLLPMLIPQGTALDIPAVMLSLLAWGGGVILYATRAAWLSGVPVSSADAPSVKMPETAG